MTVPDAYAPLQRMHSISIPAHHAQQAGDRHAGVPYLQCGAPILRMHAALSEGRQGSQTRQALTNEA